MNKTEKREHDAGNFNKQTFFKFYDLKIPNIASKSFSYYNKDKIISFDCIHFISQCIQIHCSNSSFTFYKELYTMYLKNALAVIR